MRTKAEARKHQFNIRLNDAEVLRMGQLSVHYGLDWSSIFRFLMTREAKAIKRIGKAKR